MNWFRSIARKLAVGAAASAADWRGEGRQTREVAWGVDFGEGWTLPDAPVAYLRTSGPAETSLVWRGSEPLAPGRRYAFSVLAAVHRCRAALTLEILDRHGFPVVLLERGVDPAARGGRDRSAYHHLEIEFEAPQGETRLTVRFRKGPPLSGQDSFLFAAEGQLRELEPAATAETPTVLPGLLAADPAEASAAWLRRGDRVGRRLAAHRAWLAAPGPQPDIGRLFALADDVMAADQEAAIDFRRDRAPEVTVLLEAGADERLLRRSLAALLASSGGAPLDVRLVGEATGGEGGNAAAHHRPLARLVVLMQAGWEPVAGWLQELEATLDNFGVDAAAPKLIGADGFLVEDDAAAVAGDNPRDPAFNYARPVSGGWPLMVRRDLLEGVPLSGARELAAHVHEALRDRHGVLMYCPTAEFWALDGACIPPLLRETPPLIPPEPLFRVLYIDQEAPTVDMDAGGYAAFQEMRLLQALGGKVDFLPKNMAWMDRHTLALQRAGIECIYAPFALSFEHYLRDHAAGYDFIFVLRHKIARLVQAAIADLPTRPKVVLNLADLHFLRELREAAVGTPGYTVERARETQAAELEVIAAADLTLSYSDVEMEILRHHGDAAARVALAPWVVEPRDAPIGSFETSSGLLFLGGFGHPPNAEAVRRFVDEVMPLVTAQAPEVRLRVVGSKATPEVLALQGPAVEVLGYVADLDDAFAEARIFVAPLLAGAGLKGKVIEAMARGVPMVLTPIAAEGAGLTDGVDCLIAASAREQADAIVRLHADPELWRSLATNSLATARRRFSFAGALETLRAALDAIGVPTSPEPSLHYRFARPDPNHGASAAPVVLRLP